MSCLFICSGPANAQAFGHDSWRLTADDGDFGVSTISVVGGEERRLKYHAKGSHLGKSSKMNFFQSSRIYMRRSAMSRRINKLRANTKIQELFNKYANADGFILTSRLKEFYEMEQNEYHTEEDLAQEIMFDHPQGLDLDEFAQLVLSMEKNAIYKESCRKVSQDMSRPLSHYYIASSHNTYLHEHNQVVGTSHYVGIGNALRIGAKLIELDCFDGPRGEPIISHKMSFVKPITFERCIAEVKTFRRKCPGRDYPLIITLENYCSDDQQRRQCEILRDAFGEDLICSESKLFDDKEICKFTKLKGPDEWLCPNELRGKIIIRDRPWKPKKKIGSGRERGTEAVTIRETNRSGLPRKQYSNMTNTSSNGTLQSVESDITILSEDAMYYELDEKKVKKKRTDELLSLLYIRNVNLTKTTSTSPEDYFLDMSATSGLTSSSLGHEKLEGFLKRVESAEGMINYTRNNLVRVYPKLNTKTVKSVNFNPMGPWSIGCQMVALNYQRHEEQLWLNHGLFTKNARCGYVLKPECLISGDDYDGEIMFDHNEEKNQSHIAMKEVTANIVRENVQIGHTGVMEVAIISGHNLPKPSAWKNLPLNLVTNKTVYVEISLYAPFGKAQTRQEGHDHGFCQKWTSAATKLSGMSPSWTDKRMGTSTFFKVRNLELEKNLAVLLFVVRVGNRHRDIIGQYAIPVDCIRQGYRVLPLRKTDCSREKDERYLLCHFTLPTFFD